MEIVNGSISEGLALSESKKLTNIGIKVVGVLGLSDFIEIPIAKEQDQNILLLSSRNLDNMETVKYLTKRYQAQVQYNDACKCPAVLILFNEP